MDKATATDLITDFRDNEADEVTVRLNDGTEHTGRPISVNSKGVNLQIDGKTRSFGLTRIDSIFVDNGEDDEEDDLNTRLNEVADEISDGATTAEVAAALSDVLDREITPKELRVHLRALGLGVGKGRKYALSAGELRAVHNVIIAADLADAAN